MLALVNGMDAVKSPNPLVKLIAAATAAAAAASAAAENTTNTGINNITIIKN